MRSSDPFVVLGAVLALTLAPREAHATPNFPGVIASELQISAPDCSLCHGGGATGRGTVTTPFGTSMRARGLAAFDEGSLKTALAALTAEHTDSDGDGTPDIAELKAGTDPNTASGESSVGPPEYGCGAAPARATTPTGAAAIALAAVAMVGVARRRRAPR